MYLDVFCSRFFFSVINLYVICTEYVHIVTLYILYTAIGVSYLSIMGASCEDQFKCCR